VTTTEVPAPPQAQARTCQVCGDPSDASECTTCVIAIETAWKRRDDR
jgi:hypothetical protein